MFAQIRREAYGLQKRGIHVVERKGFWPEQKSEQKRLLAWNITEHEVRTRDGTYRNKEQKNLREMGKYRDSD